MCASGPNPQSPDEVLEKTFCDASYSGPISLLAGDVDREELKPSYPPSFVGTPPAAS